MRDILVDKFVSWLNERRACEEKGGSVRERIRWIATSSLNWFLSLGVSWKYPVSTDEAFELGAFGRVGWWCWL